jgi:hypothetical protein
MPNGTYRDSFAMDIGYHGIPTFSPVAGYLVRRLFRVCDSQQREAVIEHVRRWETEIDRESISQWLVSPSAYLSELEPEHVTRLVIWLEEQLPRRIEEARSRGWEIE